MHESTISRVTSNKYMATPRGLYELKYFFTSAISASGRNGAHSAEAVRDRIRELIDGEPDSTLSGGLSRNAGAACSRHDGGRKRTGMLSRNLEKSLHQALAYANERRHEYATLEHLLLELTEDQDAVAVLRACAVDLDRLRREVLNYVDNELGNLVAAHGDDAKPTASLQRVLRRTAIHVQSSR
jgi:DNA-directed RNA polymerase specialized sigma54-like protein